MTLDFTSATTTVTVSAARARAAKKAEDKAKRAILKAARSTRVALLKGKSRAARAAILAAI